MCIAATGWLLGWQWPPGRHRHTTCGCGPGEGKYGTLTLVRVFDDCFLPLKVPFYSGALFGHIRRKLTLPVGLEVEMDADAGTVRFLQPAVL